MKYTECFSHCPQDESPVSRCRVLMICSSLSPLHPVASRAILLFQVPLLFSPSGLRAFISCAGSTLPPPLPLVPPNTPSSGQCSSFLSSWIIRIQSLDFLPVPHSCEMTQEIWIHTTWEYWFSTCIVLQLHADLWGTGYVVNSGPLPSPAILSPSYRRTQSPRSHSPSEWTGLTV